MLLDDPLVKYLDEGGKINPGFRLRNPIVPEEVLEVPEEPTVEPDIGTPPPPPPLPDVMDNGEVVYGNGNTSYRGAPVPGMYGDGIYNQNIADITYNPYDPFNEQDDLVSFGNSFTAR